MNAATWIAITAGSAPPPDGPLPDNAAAVLAVFLGVFFAALGLMTWYYNARS